MYRRFLAVDLGSHTSRTGHCPGEALARHVLVPWALDRNRPAYAFMVDPAAPWSGPREQDRLVTATTQAQSIEVWRAVRGLHELRAFLDGHTTRELFQSPEQLASLVATSLFPWLLENAAPVRASTSADQAPALGIPADQPPQAHTAPMSCCMSRCTGRSKFTFEAHGN